MIYFVQVCLSSDKKNDDGHYSPFHITRIFDIEANDKKEAKKMAVKLIREEFSYGDCSVTILAEADDYIDDKSEYIL